VILNGKGEGAAGGNMVRKIVLGGSGWEVRSDCEMSTYLLCRGERPHPGGRAVKGPKKRGKKNGTGLTEGDVFSTKLWERGGEGLRKRC